MEGKAWAVEHVERAIRPTLTQGRAKGKGKEQPKGPIRESTAQRGTHSTYPQPTVLLARPLFFFSVSLSHTGRSGTQSNSEGGARKERRDGRPWTADGGDGSGSGSAGPQGQARARTGLVRFPRKLTIRIITHDRHRAQSAKWKETMAPLREACLMSSRAAKYRTRP